MNFHRMKIYHQIVFFPPFTISFMRNLFIEILPYFHLFTKILNKSTFSLGALVEKFYMKTLQVSPSYRSYRLQISLQCNPILIIYPTCTEQSRCNKF